MLDTFKNPSAERVPSECSKARYIADIFQKDIFTAGSDILPIYCRYISDAIGGFGLCWISPSGVLYSTSAIKTLYYFWQSRAENLKL